MELLDIKLPPKTRMQYANLESQQVWSKKIEKAKNVYGRLELESVKHGLRDCMIYHHLTPNDLDMAAKSLIKEGLIVVPLSKEPLQQGGFSHVSGTYRGGGFTYRSVITRDFKIAKEFVEAHETGDDKAIGRLLGYPDCCSEFFSEVWRKGYIDPIWQQAENTASPEIIKNRRDFLDDLGVISKKLIRFKPHKENFKILQTFRYIGVRLVPHLPHSYDCEKSIKMANDWIQLARDLKIDGLDEALEILQLPHEWDAYKGIAIINTPVFKIVTTSVPCYPNHVVQQESDFYPEEAPTGIQFPWRIKTKC